MMFETRINKPGSDAPSRGKALRAIGWPELTARINAARDLRQALIEDASLASASFSDAAAGYFSDLKQGKRGVNPNALGGRKACEGMEKVSEELTETGDRES